MINKTNNIEIQNKFYELKVRNHIVRFKGKKVRNQDIEILDKKNRTIAVINECLERFYNGNICVCYKFNGNIFYSLKEVVESIIYKN